MTEAVRLRGASKRYGDFVALDRVDLDIHRGEVFALLGPNGAGKTTLISLVAGTALPSEGLIEVLGRDVVRDYRFTRRAVGLVPQEINFDPFFTVEETLRFQAGYFGVRLSDERAVEILKNLGLLDKRGANTRALSGGMKRRLRSPRRWSTRPRSCSSTSPPRASTWSFGAISGATSSALPRRAPPWSSPPTISKKPSSSPTASA